MPACPSCGASNPEDARFCNRCGARLAASPEDPERSGERRVVTMLFCDVRGSTAMAERLDPEEWTDLMNAAYEHLIEPVIRHEGTVARLMGDAILAFFGAPTAHEDDPQRAVMAGLEIVAAIAPFRERLVRERGLDLDVRVGINTGPVVVGEVGSELRHEYTAMGDAVNVAARMEQTAEPGTVQITEETYRLVADLFDVEPLGGVELKGKREPVPSYRVLGRLGAPWRVRAARSLDARLVGRDRELASIMDALERTGDGAGTVLVLVGEPGIGKSRLVDEANARWAELEPDDERRWDLWHCVPFDVMQPYAQYRRVIRDRAGIEASDTAAVARSKIAAMMRDLALEGWVEASARVARALLGVEGEDDEPLEGEAFRTRAIDLVVGSTLAQPGRRLVVFEDLHWCDDTSLELIRETTRLVEDHPYVFLITMRPDASAPSWGFKTWLETSLAASTVVVELAPLTDAESESLLDELLPAVEMSEELRSRILGTTDGNPLFVEEVARSLKDGGALERAGDVLRVAPGTSWSMPTTVQRLITVGLDRLPEPARRTLQTAAVIGRTFETDLLRGVADGADVDADLAELERHGLIRGTTDPTPAFEFRHALTQEAAYASLLVKHRRGVHLRVARALEASAQDRLEDVAPLLALHFAEAGDDASTLRYAELAGDVAARLYANVEAAAHYRTALDAAGRVGADATTVRSLFERRGGALELAGRHHDAIATYEEMRAAARDRGDERMELAANGAIALLLATASPLFDPEAGRRLSEENAVMARRLGDRAAEARALWNVVVANVYGGGDPVRAAEAGEASLAIARELGDRDQVAFTLNDVSRAHMATGDFAIASTRLDEARTLWEAVDNRPMLGENLTLSALLRLLAGDHEGALELARTALQLSEETGNRWGASFALMAVYRVERDRGELGAAMRSIERCGELGAEGGFAYAGVATRADLARLLAYLGDAERALMLADEAFVVAEEQAPPAASVAAVAQAEARIALGDPAGATAALGRIDGTQLPEPDRTFTLTFAALAQARIAIAAGRSSDAVRLVGDALARLRGNEVEILVAELLVVLGRAHLAMDDADAAGPVLADAAERAERLGERLSLWEALALTAEVHARRDDDAAASRARGEARSVVDAIATSLDDEDLRDRFLGRGDVLALGD